MNSIELSESEHRAFVELPTKSLEQLREMLETETKKNQDKDYELIQSLHLEILRREENLETKTMDQLVKIQVDTHRELRYLENYVADAVADSSPENQQGFGNHLSQLDTLIDAVELEIRRREVLDSSSNFVASTSNFVASTSNFVASSKE